MIEVWQYRHSHKEIRPYISQIKGIRKGCMVFAGSRGVGVFGISKVNAELHRYFSALEDGNEEAAAWLFIGLSKLLLIISDEAWSDEESMELSAHLEELCRLVIERLELNNAPIQSHLDFHDVLVRIKRMQNRQNRTIENRQALVRSIEQRLAIKEQMGLDTQFDAISISVMSREIKMDMA